MPKPKDFASSRVNIIVIICMSNLKNQSGIEMRMLLLLLGCIVFSVSQEILPCSMYENVTSLTEPVCCLNDRNDSYSCIPKIIIAGTQKSGTTALAGLLSQLPSIVFSKQKEVHFFDKNSSLDKHALDVSNYMKYFTISKTEVELLNQSLIASPEGHRRNKYDQDMSPFPMFADATPFYIASRLVCRRMSVLYDNPRELRVIILLRDPMERLFSEYHMKRRYTPFMYSMLLYAPIL